MATATPNSHLGFAIHWQLSSWPFLSPAPKLDRGVHRANARTCEHSHHTRNRPSCAHVQARLQMPMVRGELANRWLRFRRSAGRSIRRAVILEACLSFLQIGGLWLRSFRIPTFKSHKVSTLCGKPSSASPTALYPNLLNLRPRPCSANCTIVNFVPVAILLLFDKSLLFKSLAIAEIGASRKICTYPLVRASVRDHGRQNVVLNAALVASDPHPGYVGGLSELEG
jgi:hypothetical protein